MLEQMKEIFITYCMELLSRSHEYTDIKRVYNDDTTDIVARDRNILYCIKCCYYDYDDSENKEIPEDISRAVTAEIIKMSADLYNSDCDLGIIMTNISIDTPYIANNVMVMDSEEITFLGMIAKANEMGIIL